MDIFEELFGDVFSEKEIHELILLRNNGMLKCPQIKGSSKLTPNKSQLKVFASVLSDVYKLAERDEDIKVIPPDITPDTAFRINLEVPISMNFSGKSLEILQRILPKVSAFGFGIKEEELKRSFTGDVETVEFGFVIPDVYTYPFDEETP